MAEIEGRASARLWLSAAENHSDFGSFTELVCMWLHPSRNLSFVDAAVIVECRDVCRKGELQLAQFRPNHVCGAIKLIKQGGLRVIATDGYGLYATSVAIQILQLIAEEFLFCFFKDTKLRKFTLELLERFGLLGWNHFSTLLGFNLKLSSKAYMMLFVSTSRVDEVLSLEDVRNDRAVVGSSGRCTNGGESANVYPAFVFCLYHLGMQDLLSVSMVCKSLHTIICDDSLLWKHIHICQPLNEKITEDALLRLTERAQGTLQCLRLVDCCRITDDCLKRVLDRNPQVVKLGVPGCTRITIDDILSTLKSVGKLQVKHLDVGGIFGVTKDHFDELFDLLNIDDNVSTAGKKAMQKKEDDVLADQLGRMSVSRKRSYYHLFAVSFHSFSLQEWSKHYDLIRQTIVALSGWFGSILEFLYGSLPRPPDVLYVFSPKLTFSWLFKSKMLDEETRCRCVFQASSHQRRIRLEGGVLSLLLYSLVWLLIS